jgi:hypothetical protein
MQLANAVEPVQDGRIYIEKIKGPFLFQLKGTPAEYKAGLERQLLEPSNGLDQAVLSFETKVARCSAVLRLRGGRCWTLLTSVAELKGFEENIARVARTERR